MNETVKTGLVLEGGAMRGLFTAGVIDVMMEHGLEFDGLIGVSAGSNFGCNYKSCQPGRVLRYNLRYASDPRYMGLRSLLTTGNLVGAEFAYHTLPLELDVFDSKRFRGEPDGILSRGHGCCHGSAGVLPDGPREPRFIGMAPGLGLDARGYPTCEG